MNEDRYNELLSRIDKECERLSEKLPGEFKEQLTENNSQVSPVYQKEAVSPSASHLKITKDIRIDNLDMGERLMMHTLLHLFYGNNGGKNLSVENIEELHERLVEKLSSHSRFDKLDDRCERV